MIYLVFAIASSAMVSIVMRFSEAHIKNNISMLAVNYIMCLILAGGYTGFSQMISHGEGSGIALGLGIINGFFYLLSFVLLQMNVKKNGVVLSATFMKLGVLVPTMVAVICFGEMPTVVQVCGFIVAIAAIILIHFEKGQTNLNFKAGLILLLVVGGSGDAMSKVYEEVGDIRFEENFLCWTFIAAFILCMLLALGKRQKLSREDVFFGLLIGIPNYYSARFLLKALGSIPAVVTYPTYSVATIVLVSLAGTFVFHETMSGRRKAAIGMILGALILLNI